MVIETRSLRLLVPTPAEVLARIDAMSPAERAEVSPDWLARVRTASTPDPWILGFSMMNRTSGAVIGSCAFKAPPDAEGIVEIAYGVEGEHQGRGYATEAAGAMVEFAFASGLVRLVRAHTRPGNAASQRVLARNAFQCVGEVMDPEDGLVLRWERAATERERREGPQRSGHSP
jgi:RimJ/RimL family protein N-acetyltransferase